MPEDNLQETQTPDNKPVENQPVNEQSQPAVSQTPLDDKFGKGPWHRRMLRYLKENKKVSIPLAIVLVLLVLLAIPFTRYKILGLFWKQTVYVVVKDSATNQPVSEATVTIAGKSAKTNSTGSADLNKIPVGTQKISVTKKYYKDASSKVLVGLRQSKSKTPFMVSVQATGRQVPVAVNSKITGQPLADVLVTAGESEGRTDKEGKVLIVVPAEEKTSKVTISAQGYNSFEATLEVTEQSVPGNTFLLAPAGKIYFLSKLSGKVDVVKTNLDGSERQIVLAGTGKEDTKDTVLLASRDWKYLALKSKRDGGNSAKLFLIDTSSDKVTTMDEGDAYFTLNGWDDHRFVFTVDRNTVQLWQPKKYALKSFNAESKQLATLDETEGVGSSDSNYASDYLDNVYVLPGKVVYTRTWRQYNNLTDITLHKTRIMSVDPGGQNKNTLKDFSTTTTVYVSNIVAKLYEPTEVYFWINFVGKDQEFYKYQDNKVILTTEANPDTFNKFYSTYLLSPSGKAAFWYEPRDGKNTLFTGNNEGKDEKQIATLSEYTPYGWFSDEYLLVSKNSSELFIMPKVGTKEGGQVLKITDYHKPFADFVGYGGGYGGF